MNLQFTHPHWLWLLPVAAAWVVWLARTSDAHAGPVRRWAACAVRVVVVTAMVLALAGVRWMQAVDGVNVIFLLDRSDSVPASQQARVRQWLAEVVREKRPEDRAGVVVFGEDARIEASATEAFEPREIGAVVATARTDIGGALRLASAAFPETGQKRIVLVSDGNQNLGDALGAAVSARALDVSVDVLPTAVDRRVDVSIQRLQVPARLRKGQTFEVRVLVQASQAGPAVLRLYRNEVYLGEQGVELVQGKNVYSFPQSLPESGFYTYDARIDSVEDGVPQNNRAFGFTQVQGVPRVLVLSSDPAADAPFAEALGSPEIEVRVVGVAGFPGSLAELQSFETVVLCNVSAGDLGRESMKLLESAVRDFGTGLVCVGGDQSYGAGAYRGTPLADLLPVEVELSSRKVLPPGALVLVIDRSGSMVGEKLEMAKQGAAAAVQALAPGDYVGVIAFDGEPRWVVELQKAGNRDRIIRSILGIDRGGGTVLYPAMAEAHRMLRGVTASLKHCVVLTDGVSVADDFDGLTRAMVSDRVTVSTVGIGDQIDGDLLAGIASIGRGRFYAVPLAGQLPQIFLKETAIVLKSAIKEEAFNPRLVMESESVRGIGGASYPPLLGYVVTEARPRAETPLVTADGDPLLAHWQYGLGRVVAFTSDARAKWGREWVGWGQYQQFWRQAVQWSLRRVDTARFAAQVSLEGGEGRVSVDALDEDSGFENFLDLRAVVVAPDGGTNLVRLGQTGPGRYEAAFPMRTPGVHLVNLLRMEAGRVGAALAVGASLDAAPEFEEDGPDDGLLRRIAETTGGRVIDPQRAGSNPFFEDRRKTWRPHDIWDSLLMLAIVLFVIDVGIRRLDPDPQGLHRLWSMAVAFLPFRRATPAGSQVTGASMAALLARRDEARSQSAPSGDGVRLRPEVPGVDARESEQRVVRGSVPSAYAGQAQVPVPVPVEEPEGGGGTTARLLEAKRRARKRP